MKSNIVDRGIAFFSPAAALTRAQARIKLEVVHANSDAMVNNLSRNYDGASKGRHHSDWYSNDLSVNEEVLQSLALLRNRSRDLCRNNPYAINATRVLKNNIVGSGIIPTPKGDLKGRALTKLKDAWSSWATSTDCDYDDMNTFYGLQALVMKVVIESGECLVRKVRSTSKDDVPLKMQVLEGDFINGGIHNGQWQTDGTMTYFGIKIGRNGKRISYFLYKNAPTEFGAEYEEVPAEDIIHVYEVERPGQIRGVPFSCGSMTRLRDLDDYEMTARIRAKVAAAFAVFITDTAANDDRKTPAGAGMDGLERVEPGMIKTLLPGQSISLATPPTTNGDDKFVTGILRGISAGFGTSYESTTNDYSNVNFSSGRMGWIEASRNTEHMQQNLMIPRFCNKAYAWFVEACQLKGIVSFGVKVKPAWTVPKRQMIDPVKETKAIVEQLRGGLISWQDAVRAMGGEADELMEELKADAAMWDRLKLNPSIDPRFDPNRPPPGATAGGKHLPEKLVTDGEDKIQE